MPISFPASPTSSQLYTYGGRTYRWTGTAWEFVAASGEDALLRSLFVPPAPTGLTAVAGNASASLSWTAPTGVIVQAPVTDYRKQFSTDGGTTWTNFTAAASTATSATITGLVNGTAVRFRVAAVNAVGVGAYTAAVTPTAGDALFANVSLLLPMNGTGSTFTDSSPTPKTITATDATQSTAQSKFGGKSASFGGSGYLSVSGNAGVFGTADFTVEAWVYLTSAAEQFVLDTRSGVGTSGMGFRIFSDNRMYFSGSDNNSLTTTEIPLNQWVHIAWCRSGSTIRGFINGVLGGSASNSDNLTDTNLFVSSVGFVRAGQINGFIDDLRVTKAARYTANFTPPTAAFPTS